MVDSEGHVRVLDLGIAQLFDLNAVLATVDHATGTPRYMAPEQIQGRLRDQGPWTDIYSLACMIYRDLTGRSPFDGDSVLELMQKHIEEPPPKLPSPYPRALSGWLEMCLQKKTTERFQFIEHALQSLKLIELPEVASVGRFFDLDHTQKGDDEKDTLRSGPSTPSAYVPISGLQLEVPKAHRDSELGAKVIWSKDLFATRAFPVIGMAGQRQAIWSEFVRVCEGESRSIALSGSEGAGASELAHWIAEVAHERGAALSMEVRFETKVSPSHGWGPALGALLKIDGLDAPRRISRICKHPLFYRIDDEVLIPLARTFSASVATATESISSDSATPEEANQAFIELVALASRRTPIVVTVENPSFAKSFNETLNHFKTTSARVLVVMRGSGKGVSPDILIELNDPSPSDAFEEVSKQYGLSPTVAMQLVNEAQSNRFLMREILDDWVLSNSLQLGPDGAEFRAGIPNRTRNMWPDRFARAIGDHTSAWKAAAVCAVLGEAFELDLYDRACAHLVIENGLEWLDLMRDVGLLDYQENQIRWKHARIHKSMLDRAKTQIDYVQTANACAQTMADSDNFETKVAASTVLREIGFFAEALQICIDAGAIAEWLNAFVSMESICVELEDLEPHLSGTLLDEAKAWRLIWWSKVQRRKGQSSDARDSAKAALAYSMQLQGDILAQNWLQLAISTQTDSIPEALDCYQRAIDSASDGRIKTTARTGTAWALLTSGQTERAYDFIQLHDADSASVAEVDPISAARWNKIWAYVLAHRNEHEAALVRLQAGLDALGDLDSGGIHASLLTDMAESHRALGDPQKAIECLTKAMGFFNFTLDNRLAIIQTNLAMVYIQSNRWREAQKQLSRITREYEDIQSLVSLMKAACEAQSGNPKPLRSLLPTLNPSPFIRKDCVQVLQHLSPVLAPEDARLISQHLGRI